MARTLIHLDPKQKARLARRAKLRGRPFSEEVRTLDLISNFPWKMRRNWSRSQATPTQSCLRSIRRLDETMASVDRVLKTIGKRSEPGARCGAGAAAHPSRRAEHRQSFGTSEGHGRTCKDSDRRLIRIEAKFEFLVCMAAPARRRALPEKAEK